MMCSGVPSEFSKNPHVQAPPKVNMIISVVEDRTQLCSMRFGKGVALISVIRFSDLPCWRVDQFLKFNILKVASILLPTIGRNMVNTDTVSWTPPQRARLVTLRKMNSYLGSDCVYVP